MTVLGGFSQSDSLPILSIDSTEYFLLTRPQAEEAAKTILSLDQCLINKKSYESEIIDLRLMDKEAVKRAEDWAKQSGTYNKEIKLLNESLELVKEDLANQNKKTKFLKVTRNVGIPVSFGLGCYSTFYFLKTFTTI